MNPYDEAKSRKAQVLKAHTAAIRLKYALIADDEIRQVLPEIEAKIDLALAQGKPIELEPGDAFREETKSL